MEEYKHYYGKNNPLKEPNTRLKKLQSLFAWADYYNYIKRSHNDNDWRVENAKERYDKVQEEILEINKTFN